MRIVQYYPSNPRLFDDYAIQDQLDQQTNRNKDPQTNIRENEDTFFIDMAIPGWSKKELSISLEKDLLKIEGIPEKEENNLPGWKMGMEEFTKSFRISQIEEDKIKAGLSNGILSLELPKIKKVQSKRIIQIQ